MPSTEIRGFIAGSYDFGSSHKPQPCSNPRIGCVSGPKRRVCPILHGICTKFAWIILNMATWGGLDTSALLCTP